MGRRLNFEIDTALETSLVTARAGIPSLIEAFRLTGTAAVEISAIKVAAPNVALRIIDRAMQVHGGLGYSRHMPFEHIYRHHRRYRITEGAEEIHEWELTPEQLQSVIIRYSTDPAVIRDCDVVILAPPDLPPPDLPPPPLPHIGNFRSV